MRLMQKIKRRLQPVLTGGPIKEVYANVEWVSEEPPLFPRLDMASDPRRLWNNEAVIQKETQPYPYYIKDNVITKKGFSELLQHWPERKIFELIAGFNRFTIRMQSHASWEPFNSRQRTFWSEFIATVCPRIMAESVEQFAPEIVTKYGSYIGELQLQNFELLELFDAQLPIHVHSHHFHSPLWFATAVFYIDDNGHTSRGTTIYRAKPGNDSIDQLALLASEHRTLDGKEEMELVAESAFGPNRMFIMHDNPIAWHKVEDNSKLGHIGPRRHILFNWGLPFKRMEEFYGVDRKTFMEIHEKEQGSPRLVSWIKKDIKSVRQPVSVSAEQLAALQKSITFRGLGALDLF